MPKQEYSLRVEGVRKSFGRLEALKAASLWVEAGKISSLMGRNGSGKTTLLRIAAGLLRPDQGVVFFQGEVVNRPSLPALARAGLMYVPQGRLVVPHVTVQGHLDALAASFECPLMEKAVDLCDLQGLLPQKGRELSGGERARVSLALAFARRPSVLLADEPLVGLAPSKQEELGGLLRALAAEGVGIIASGHDTRALLPISDVILWSVAGTTHHIGSPEDALQHHQFRQEYLGPGFAGRDGM